MQHWPLLVGTILDHAERQHGTQEVVSRSVEGPIHRTTYAEIARRARQCAAALARLGVRPGDRVATLAWNTHRHVEAWYGAAHIGAIYHTVNPRLFESQIAFIVNDAQDRVILADLSFVPLLERLQDSCLRGRTIILLTSAGHMPDSPLDLLCYEDLIAAEADDLPRLMLPEDAPCGLCYTSGTTGDPKGVLYSHRSNVLQALITHGPDVMALSAMSVVLPIVPMFHANAWSLAFSAPMVGAKLVLPGNRLDAESICDLMRKEGVTMAFGVPSVWIDAIPRLRAEGRGTLERLLVGGAAVPRAMVEDFAAIGITMAQGWGMTEMSPLGTTTAPKPAMAGLSPREQIDQRLKAGAPFYGVETRIVGADGEVLPCDDVHTGALQVRGPCVVAEYWRGAGGVVLDAEGWFDTGDIAAIDRFGYVRIADRAKDVIKSGGEWISSIDLECAAASHPAIREAAAIAIAHPRWGERPLLVAVRAAGASLSEAELIAWLGGRVAKWWLPDRVIFVADLPHTATGKLDKRALRQQYGADCPPTAEDNRQHC
ncbi:MAG: long-chain-fatty-acid--CoA ligase [Sphingomonadales bacterium]|nr:long-chain-fatty-acid--CoA ligase [Sphingomonadales bacterium]